MFFRYAFGVAVKSDARRLEELHHLARVAVDGAMRFIVDDKVEIERRELFAVAAIDHQRLDRGDDDRGAEQLAGAAGRLEDDRFDTRGRTTSKSSIVCLANSMRSTMNRTRSALRVVQKAADERGAKERLAGAGGHFQKKLAAAFAVEQSGNLIHRPDLITPQA